MFDLEGRVAIVTGANGNLGRAVAATFRRVGAHLVLVDRSADRLAAAYPDLASSSDHWLAGGVDLSSADSVDAVVAGAQERFGRIDILVNTVGGFRAGPPVHEESLDTWDSMLTINLRTTLNTCRAVVPVLLSQGTGRIVNVAAGAGLNAPAGFAAYSASKAAVMRLTESLSAELKGNGIGANSILPGIIDTPQNREAMPNADFSTWVSPEAIADAILFLCSEASRAITGAAIPVTGRM